MRKERICLALAGAFLSSSTGGALPHMFVTALEESPTVEKSTSQGKAVGLRNRNLVKELSNMSPQALLKEYAIEDFALDGGGEPTDNRVDLELSCGADEVCVAGANADSVGATAESCAACGCKYDTSTDSFWPCTTVDACACKVPCDPDDVTKMCVAGVNADSVGATAESCAACGCKYDTSTDSFWPCTTVDACACEVPVLQPDTTSPTPSPSTAGSCDANDASKVCFTGVNAASVGATAESCADCGCKYDADSWWPCTTVDACACEVPCDPGDVSKRCVAGANADSVGATAESCAACGCKYDTTSWWPCTTDNACACEVPCDPNDISKKCVAGVNAESVGATAETCAACGCKYDTTSWWPCTTDNACACEVPVSEPDTTTEFCDPDDDAKICVAGVNADSVGASADDCVTCGCKYGANSAWPCNTVDACACQLPDPCPSPTTCSAADGTDVEDCMSCGCEYDSTKAAPCNTEYSCQCRDDPCPITLTGSQTCELGPKSRTSGATIDTCKACGCGANGSGAWPCSEEDSCQCRNDVSWNDVEAALNAVKTTLQEKALSLENCEETDDNDCLSKLYTYDGLMKALKRMVDEVSDSWKLYLGSTTKEAKVHVAALLSQAMQETIKYDACDENNDGESYDFDNACGQGGQDYMGTSYTCSDHETIEQCDRDNAMNVVGASTNSNAPLSCTSGTDSEGCCWWGRGAIQITGQCILGEFNQNFGKGSGVYDIDFCADPGKICDNEDYTELKWFSALYYWVNNVQFYYKDDWIYREKLEDFMNGNDNANAFIDGLSKKVNRGDYDSDDAHAVCDRRANFKHALEGMGLTILANYVTCVDCTSSVCNDELDHHV